MKMPLHLGESIMISAGEIIGIFEISALKGAAMEALENNSAVRNRTEDSVCAVLIKRQEKTYAYYSKISPGRLIKRSLKGGEEK